MKFIEDGNLKEWVRIALVIFGVVLVICSVKIGLKTISSILVFLTGIVVASVGGYASQVHMLKINPFGNSCKKARDSYKTKDGEEDR
ncbi:hypothetical protein ACV229_40225 [Burkholderia sp. MR1-5-21]